MTARPRAQRRFTAEIQRAQASSAGVAGPSPVAAGPDPDAQRRHDQVMAAIALVRDEIKRLGSGGDTVAEDYKREVVEGARLKSELLGLSETIERTKREIAVLSRTAASEDRLQEMTDQLDQVVASTEQATNQILEAAEKIQVHSDTLGLHASGDDERNAIEGIQNLVISIFEACNFQDLSGQRITKVVNALKEVERRVMEMMQLFGGVQAIDEVAATIEDTRTEDEKLLGGPEHDQAKKISQDEIDKLFG